VLSRWFLCGCWRSLRGCFWVVPLIRGQRPSCSRGVGVLWGGEKRDGVWVKKSGGFKGGRWHGRRNGRRGWAERMGASGGGQARVRWRPLRRGWRSGLAGSCMHCGSVAEDAPWTRPKRASLRKRRAELDTGRGRAVGCADLSIFGVNRKALRRATDGDWLAVVVRAAVVCYAGGVGHHIGAQRTTRPQWARRPHSDHWTVVLGRGRRRRLCV
jgi:hypothetical protein